MFVVSGFWFSLKFIQVNEHSATNQKQKTRNEKQLLKVQKVQVSDTTDDEQNY